MGSKQFEQKILNYNLEINELNEYYEDNFKEVITGMLNALYVLLKHPKNNKELIEEMFLELESLAKEEENDNLKLINNLIQNLNKRIEDSFNNKSKNDIIGFRNRLYKINWYIKIKQERIKDDNITSILQKLIYEEKDLDKIKTVLSSRKHIEYETFKTLFKSILEQYILLQDEQEINYYYKLIVLFIESTFNKEILKNADIYLKILSKGNKKEHVKVVEDRFKDKTISFEELTDKYDITVNNSLIYIPNNNYTPCPYQRHDFTYQKVITIDEEGNKCNDDGVYIERNPDGTYTLYIHISDTPSLIEQNSTIDCLAYKGAETKYLKDREITIYPEVISNDLGSLIGGNKRNVISYVFRLTPGLEIIGDSFTIKRGVVSVYKSLSYEEVDMRIKRENIDSLDNMLKTLDDVATLLKNNNLHKEIYRSAENKTTDKETNSAKSSKSSAAKIVQELMVLTNRYVARYFSKRGYPYIYRIHEKPNEEIDDYLMMILGIDQKTLISNPKCIKILNAIKERYLNAKYSEQNLGHYGLGLDDYSHSTSPLRRYSDSLGQYIMYDILFNCNFDDKTIYNWEQIIKEVCPYLNERIKNNNLFANEYHYLLARRKIRKR